MSFFSNRIIGALLLIVGTSIGAGMFALPIACSGVGFWTSSLLVIFTWAVMLMAAFFILEVNLWLPKGNNMVSMAEKTLGIVGKILTWIIYVLLLYALMAAYISGGSDVLQSLLSLIGFPVSMTLSTTIFTLGFALIVYQGIKIVESVNTPLMLVKILIYVLLVLLIFPHVKIHLLEVAGQLRYLSSALLLLATSFGFAIIIPSLREQFDDDIKTLRNVIFIGSLFPLFCYLIWNTLIMGVIPRNGAQGLFILNESDHATSALTHNLSIVLEPQALTKRQSLISIISLFRGFSAIGMLTAFLGVSLCLFDFLADSLKYKKKGFSGLGLLLICFLPPFLIVMLYPGAYIKALSYAGILVILLLILFPALMAYFGRYHLCLNSSRFKVFGHKFSIVFVVLSAVVFLYYFIF